MARSMAFVCLAVAFLAAFTTGAAAGKGKGALVVTKPRVSFTKACVDVCRDKCKFVPSQICAEVAIPYKECNKVPVTSTINKCKKVCITTTTTVSEVAVPSGPIDVPFGKKGRHMMSKGKGLSLGKGVVAPTVSCKDECAEVPITTYTVQCEAKVRTATQCRKTKERVCTPVCRPKCSKVPVYSEEQVVVPVPVLGKGKGVDLLVGKGKGH